MDGLLLLLIFGALGLLSSRNKKKKADRQAARRRAFQQAKESEAQAKKAVQAKVQEKLPFTQDEWAAYLKEMGAGEKKASALKSAAKPVPKKPVQAAKPVSARPEMPKPALHLEHDDPEGSISTQGESAAEHAAHHAKVLAEEAKIREEHETMRELARMNRRQLRSAIVMSEILSKPVSLRPRGYR